MRQVVGLIVAMMHNLRNTHVPRLNEIQACFASVSTSIFHVNATLKQQKRKILACVCQSLFSTTGEFYLGTRRSADKSCFGMC